MILKPVTCNQGRRLLRSRWIFFESGCSLFPWLKRVCNIFLILWQFRLSFTNLPSCFKWATRCVQQEENWEHGFHSQELDTVVTLLADDLNPFPVQPLASKHETTPHEIICSGEGTSQTSCCMWLTFIYALYFGKFSIAINLEVGDGSASCRSGTSKWLSLNTKSVSWWSSNHLRMRNHTCEMEGRTNDIHKTCSRQYHKQPPPCTVVW